MTHRNIYRKLTLPSQIPTSSNPLPVVEAPVSQPQHCGCPTSKVDNKERDFFVYLPKGHDGVVDKKYPVMLFLHGNGERGNGKDELDYVLIHGPLYEASGFKKGICLSSLFHHNCPCSVWTKEDCLISTTEPRIDSSAT
ncbi:MAG: hypothetical protein R2788_02825 [Saprospiraceae bacterium]